MILHTQPTKRWNAHDFLLLEAYQILEEERCQQCGLPRYICHNESSDVRFRIVEDTCAAMVEKDMYEEQKRGSDKDYRAPAGTTLRPEPYAVDGRDLTTFRTQYYLDEAEKQQIISESYLRTG